MKLRIKILSGFLILATMLACAGLLSIYELLSIGASVNRLLSDNYKSINAAKTMIEALEREDSGVLLVLSGKWENGRETIESGDLAFQKAFETAKNNITIPDENKYVDSIASNYQTYKALWMEPLAGTKKEHNLDWYFEEIHGVFQTAKQSVEELMVLNDETMYLTASSLRNRANRAVMPGIVAIISSLVFVLIFNYFINYFVIKPINILAQEAKNSIRTREPLKIDIETKDELRDLASAIQELASSRQRQP
jgi:nitrate/nitrite-specific signal transduction histidine kinase